MHVKSNLKPSAVFDTASPIPGYEGCLLATSNKNPMGKGQFGSHHLKSPLLTPLSPFCKMSPLRRSSHILPQAEEFNPESFWIEGSVGSAFSGETSRLFEGGATTFEGPPALPTNHLLLSFEDDHPCRERLDHAVNVHNAPLDVRPEDLYVFFLLTYPSITTADCSSLGPEYQAAYRELFYDSDNTYVLAPVPDNKSPHPSVFSPVLPTPESKKSGASRDAGRSYDFLCPVVGCGCWKITF